jgi:hypothetical protein
MELKGQGKIENTKHTKPHFGCWKLCATNVIRKGTLVKPVQLNVIESATEHARMNAMEEDVTRENSNHMEDSPLRNRRKSQIIHSMWERAAVTRNSGALTWYTWDKSVFVNFKPMVLRCKMHKVMQQDAQHLALVLAFA